MNTQYTIQHSRFEYLDGIRGVAAIFVLIRHTGGLWGFEFFRSYLAVDIFFILSGFVIAHAYDEKLRSAALSFTDFAKLRVVRLYPVFIFSLALMSAVMLLQTLAGKHHGDFSWAQFGEVIALTALFLPSHLGKDNALFPINSPYWSLFFELVANFVYALVRPVLSVQLNLFIVLLAGAFMALVGLRNGDLNIGFQWGMESIVGGLARAHFGFFLGLFLYRYHAGFARWCQGRVSHWYAMAAVVAILASPSFGALNAWADLLFVGLLFPLCLMIAAQPAPAASTVTKALVLLGAASYPLYVLHLPLVKILYPGLKFFPKPLGGLVFLAFVVVFSIWLERKYDIPLRRKIMTQLRKTKVFA